MRGWGGDWHHRRETALFDEWIDEHARGSRENAVRGAFGCDRAWHAGRKACRVSGPARPRAPHPPKRDKLPRERLRDEVAGRGAHHLRKRCWVAEGKPASGRVSRSRPVLRPHEKQSVHFFWRRNRCPRGVRVSALR